MVQIVVSGRWRWCNGTFHPALSLTSKPHQRSRRWVLVPHVLVPTRRAWINVEAATSSPLRDHGVIMVQRHPESPESLG